MFGKNILILAAHPDDEVVASAACIARARAGGARVAALYLTHGCLARAAMWAWDRKNDRKIIARRRAEGEKAAALLGIETLGWANRPARALWRELPQVQHEIAAAIDAYKPDQIWAPAYEGGNPDHDGLNAVASVFRARLSVLEFAEYHFFGGKAHSNSFISNDETARIITLTEEERAAKRAALDLYKSERGNLSAVTLEQESYRPLARYDYAQPPHQGKVWYARFDWVPFRHPRVDFTDPAEVSAAITKFL